MSRDTTRIGSLTLLGAAALALFFLRWRGDRSSSPTVVTSAATTHAAATPDRSSQPLELPSVPIGEASISARTERPDGTWVRGRVRIPAGTPPDDRIEVVARFFDLEGSAPPTAPVAADGSFVIRFPTGVESGALDINSRVLYLENNLSLDLTTPTEDVLIEPQLGGCITGRLVRPSGISEVDGRISVARVEFIAPDGSSSTHSRSAVLDADLRFEIPHVPVGVDRVLRVTTDAFLPVERRVDVAPGSILDVELLAHLGVRVSGHVLDSEGRPVPGAVVSKTADATTMWSSISDRPLEETTSAADGGFRLRAIPPGRIGIRIAAPSRLAATQDLGELADGAVVEGLEVRLGSGLIAGRVEWPDGTPAAECSVEMYGPRPSSAPHGRTAADGRFSIEVSADIPYCAFVRSTASVGSSRGSCGVATMCDLHPGQDPVVLRLESGYGIHGRVIDDAGQAVDSFAIQTIGAGGIMSSGGDNSWSPQVHARFDSVQGEFDIPCLPPGRWLLAATVDQRTCNASELVTLPRDTSPIVIVVPRSARLSGVVLDPSGAPAPHARVHARGSSRDDVADEKGRFRLTDIEPEETSLWASSESWAPSDDVDVSPGAGQLVDELVLRLRVGGSILGQALDLDGHADAGRRITLYPPWRDDVDATTTDSRGAFELHHIPPGRYALVREFQMGTSADSEPMAQQRFAASKTRLVVDVVEGATTQVVIGGPRGANIDVHGRITLAGSPIPDVRIVCYGRTPFEDESESNETDTGVDGKFSLHLGEPDRYEFRITPSDTGTEILLQRWLTEGRDFELDIDLPEGSIRGEVLASDGRRAAGVPVELVPTRMAEGTADRIAYGSTTTDAEGRFVFLHVPGGAYELGSSSSSESSDAGVSLLPGEVKRLILAEGANTENVVLRVR